MKELPVPLPLLILFGVSVVAVVVFTFAIGPVAEPAAPQLGTVRVQVLAAGGEPRGGVTLILVKNSAERAVIARPTDASGHVEIRAAVGRYDVRVYPKKLATREARAAFRAERKLDAAGLIRHQLMVGNVEIPAAAEPTAVTVRLPTAASY